MLDAWSWADKKNYKKSIKIIDSINSNEYQFVTIFHKALIYDLVDEVELAEIYFDQSLMLNNEIYILNLYLSFLDRNNKIEKKERVIKQYLSGYDQDFIKRIIKYKPQRIVENKLEGVAIALFNTLELISGISDNQKFLLISLASAISDNFYENRFILADTLATISDHETAIKLFKSIPSENYLAEITALKIVNIYSMNGDNEKAINFLTNNKLIKNSFQGLMSLGNLYRYKSQWNKAIDVYKQAINAKKNEPDFNLWDSYYKIGMCYERKKDWKKAEKYLLKALDYSSYQPDVLNYLGYTYLDLDISNKFDDAKNMLEQALKQKPDDAYVLDSMGWYFFKVGRFNESLQLFQYAILIDPSDPTINDHFGDVLWKSGKFSQARYQWRKALDVNENQLSPDKIKKKLILGI
jgi:tetratricopeptide (TPR) repeat protein